MASSLGPNSNSDMIENYQAGSSNIDSSSDDNFESFGEQKQQNDESHREAEEKKNEYEE